MPSLARYQKKRGQTWSIWYRPDGGEWERKFLGRRDDGETRVDDLLDDGTPLGGVLVIGPVDFNPRGLR